MSFWTRWGAVVPTWCTHPSRNARSNLIILAISAMSACADATPTTIVSLETGPDLSLASIAVVGGDNQAAEVGELAPGTLAVHVVDGEGRPVPSLAVEWDFRDGVGRLGSTEDSFVRGVTDANGRAEIRWILGSRAGLQQVDVSFGTPTSSASAAPGGNGNGRHSTRFLATARPGRGTTLVVEPGSSTAIEGEEVQYTAELQDRYGNAVTPSDVTWSSASPAVATVDGAGMVSALGDGTTDISAETGGVTGTARLTVEAAPEPEPGAPDRITDLTIEDVTQTSIRLRWTQVLDGAGSAAPTMIRFDEGSMRWSDADNTEVTVAPTQAGQSMEYTISGLEPDTRYQFQVAGYRADGPDIVFGSRSPRVAASTDPIPPVLTTVLVSPGQSTIPEGGVALLNATGFDQNGQVMSVGSWSWTSSNNSVATVNQNGLVTALSNGSTTVTAVSQGVSGAANVSVTTAAPIIDWVVVTPETTTVDEGAAEQLEVHVFDIYGNQVQGVDVSWVSSNPAIAGVSQDGSVLGNEAGSATVSASVDGVTGSAAIVVNGDDPEPPAVDEIVVTPATSTLTVGASIDFSATVYDTEGNVMTGESVTWSSSNSSVVSVNGGGAGQAVSEGVATVSATIGSVSGSASVIVEEEEVAAEVDWIVVSPPTPTVSVGGNVSFAATVYDTNGDVMAGESVSWSTSNGGVLSVDGNGDGEAHAIGVATVTATIGSVTGTALVTVEGGPGDPPPAATPFWEHNWDYASTQEMINANTNSYSLGEVSLESGTLFDGSTGNFMRAHLRGDGSEDETNYDMNIPGAGAGVTDEVWIEIWVRFDDNWYGTSDDKTLFVWPARGSRWEIHYGLGQRVYGGPSSMPGDFFIVSDDGNRLDVEDVWDGQWHRHRLHLRASSSQGASDGAFEWWFDDQELVTANQPALYGSRTGEGLNTGSSYDTHFTSMRLGANADPRGSGQRDWGRIRIWTSNPGW